MENKTNRDSDIGCGVIIAVAIVCYTAYKIAEMYLNH